MIADLVLDRADFGRRVEVALRVAANSIAVLAAPGQHRDGDRKAFTREKFICETALLLYAVKSVPDLDPHLGKQVFAVAESLATYARAEDILATMAIRPVMAPELSVAHVCISKIGIPDARFSAAVKSMVAGGYPTPERAPWKDIEADWLGQLDPSFQRPFDLNVSIARTTLATGLDAIASRREDVYAFTHALIYLTDFGRLPVNLPRPLHEVELNAEAALARCMDEDDFDLAGEVLLAWPYLRLPLSESALFALSVLTGMEDEIGFLPSLTLRAGIIDSTDGKRKAFDEAYHTAYVMGLLCAALLLPQALVDAAIKPASEGSGKAIRKLMPAKLPAPQWEQAFDSLQEHRQDCLADFVASVALRRSLAQNDVRQLRTILIVCLEHGLTHSQCVRQSGSLLQRLAAVAG
jgi:hypothetical protein